MEDPRSSRRARPGWVLFLGGVLVALLLARPERAQTQAPARGMMTHPGGTADSNGRMIAVTGTDITGASILYLVDTENQQLAIYQASGGAGSSTGVKFVGARRISLDLQLDGFNDRSEFTYKDLRKEFETEGLLAPSAGDESAPDDGR